MQDDTLGPFCLYGVFLKRHRSSKTKWFVKGYKEYNYKQSESPHVGSQAQPLFSGGGKKKKVSKA